MGRTRKNILTAGAQRHGKTFWAERFAEDYIKRGNAFIYNYGKSDDYRRAEEIEILSINEHSKFTNDKKGFLKNPSITLFAYKNNVYHFRDFNKIFVKKMVRCRKLDDKSERFLFEAIYKYIFDTLIIFDDSRSLIRYGMSDKMINLFSRRDHTGEFSSSAYKNNGVDILFQYHNIENIKSEQFTYSTHLLLFHHNYIPDLNNINENELKNSVSLTLEELKNPSPKYQCFLINTVGGERTHVKDVTFRAN